MYLGVFWCHNEALLLEEAMYFGVFARRLQSLCVCVLAVYFLKRSNAPLLQFIYISKRPPRVAKRLQKSSSYSGRHSPGGFVCAGEAELTIKERACAGYLTS